MRRALNGVAEVDWSTGAQVFSGSTPTVGKHGVDNHEYANPVEFMAQQEAAALNMNGLSLCKKNKSLWRLPKSSPGGEGKTQEGVELTEGHSWQEGDIGAYWTRDDNRWALHHCLNY